MQRGRATESDLTADLVWITGTRKTPSNLRCNFGLLMRPSSARIPSQCFGSVFLPESLCSRGLLLPGAGVSSAAPSCRAASRGFFSAMPACAAAFSLSCTFPSCSAASVPFFSSCACCSSFLSLAISSSLSCVGRDELPTLSRQLSDLWLNVQMQKHPAGHAYMPAKASSIGSTQLVSTFLPTRARRRGRPCSH